MLIGLCGKARAGKNTVGDILVANGVASAQYSFATPLKRIINTLFGWEVDNMDLPFKDQEVVIPDIYIKKATEEYLRWHLDVYEHPFQAIRELLAELEYPETDVDKWKIAPRKPYQVFGTDVMRKKHENVWVNIAPTEDVIITDVRFENEAEWLKANNGILIFVDRPNAGIASTHSSESYLQAMLDKGMVDYVIPNYGDKIELRNNVKKLVTILKRSFK